MSRFSFFNKRSIGCFVVVLTASTLNQRALGANAREKAMEKIYSSYQRGKWQDLRSEAKVFLKQSSASLPENEIVLFWVLQGAMQEGDWAMVQKVADRLIAINGVRKSHALYAKGVAHLEVGNKELALRQFRAVIRDYKGSPASQKAWMKLRLLKVK